MRKKERRLITAFYTTHDAMAFEDYCRAKGANGRLIPLPREISAGCGLAWSAPPDDEEGLKELLEGAGIRAQVMRVVEV
ncbi:MAG: DUF3343 domain-containing protein [Lachnospiraceae bacterium]|nr:DUF3343 domain-containing protein [Lachnospiraceae bacterium]